jgi:hypothetical protein
MMQTAVLSKSSIVAIFSDKLNGGRGEAPGDWVVQYGLINQSINPWTKSWRQIFAKP